MVDISVKSGAAWVCHAQGHHLADILLPVHLSNKDDHEEELSQSEGDKTNWGPPVLLEQTEEGSPCVLMLNGSPCSPTAISRILVISEARTMEVYDQTGEYCGTVRGEREDSIQPDSSDRGPFYKKQLILEHPSSSCEVKLLSLGGRSSVLVCRVIVALQTLEPCASRGPGIDMQQVQCLVEEMGTSLSPGAQNLMEMVHFQQKNQTSSLGGFLPLLMGSGVFSALSQGANIPPTLPRNQPHPEDSRSPVGSIRPAGEAPLAQNGAMSDGSSTLSPDLQVITQNIMSSVGRGPVSHSQLAEIMSHLMKGQERGEGPGPELRPLLQGLCGQVTKLRLDDAAALAEKEKMMRNGSWELDSAMERRLEDMERRLTEHVDRRLDALEQKLEKALLLALSQGAMGSSEGGDASTGPSEQTAPTPASQ
ncbi:ATPase PAAT [Trematomus bernacchii]|uniref:ATPase PAAT n=1 Tax=Trematomus bernacchii TaxID=40690 RepID=UPI00146D62D8|nr:ATPase PAAT [Trematomus bernacchii]XP_033975762.1 ATPase PAAT [Trematomus bernacchii]XP_033975764.1 ATPase PAAT [Trematomus bernacchii]XP_033975765.1 ATPase PAAT [Trematomus bernacchii]